MIKGLVIKGISLMNIYFSGNENNESLHLII